VPNGIILFLCKNSADIMPSGSVGIILFSCKNSADIMPSGSVE
jgi:hypothetical protein